MWDLSWARSSVTEQSCSPLPSPNHEAEGKMGQGMRCWQEPGSRTKPDPAAMELSHTACPHQSQLLGAVWSLGLTKTRFPHIPSPQCAKPGRCSLSTSIQTPSLEISIHIFTALREISQFPRKLSQNPGRSEVLCSKSRKI